MDRRPNPSAAAADAAGTPASAELAKGSLVEGRYRVVRVIGVGGTGVVHEVEHLRTSQRLALKTLLDPSYAPRLEQEARALAKLKSRRVVKVVDMGRHRGDPYLVMSLLEGRRLRDVLEARMRPPLSFVANLALQVAEGLDEAHRAGLVHRDLKPDNLHLSERAGTPLDGAVDELAEVTVFDFGVVKFAAHDANTVLTRTGSTVGTPYYMSLEQLRGSGAVDTQSDIYSLGVVLYECLAGARPFEAGTLGDLIYAICSTEAPPLASLRPDLPKEVTSLVMRALSRDKAVRPASMRELAKALAAWADPAFTWWLRASGETIASEPTSPTIETIDDETSQDDEPRQAPPAGPPPPPVRGLSLKPPGAAPLKSVPPPRPGASVRPPPPVRGVAATARVGALPAPARLPDLSPPQAPAIELPPMDESTTTRGDRDTPTQMYLTGEEPSEGEHAPTKPLEVARLAPQLGPQAQRPLSPEDRTAVIAAPPPGGSMPGIDPRASQANLERVSFPGAPPGERPIPAPPQSYGRPGNITASGPAVRPPQGTGFVAAAPPDSPGSAAFRSQLDRVLGDVGQRGNALGRSLESRFRMASQETQLVVVIVGAATCAFAAVILVYLLIG